MVTPSYLRSLSLRGGGEGCEKASRRTVSSAWLVAARTANLRSGTRLTAVFGVRDRVPREEAACCSD